MERQGKGKGNNGREKHGGFNRVCCVRKVGGTSGRGMKKKYQNTENTSRLNVFCLQAGWGNEENT